MKNLIKICEENYMSPNVVYVLYCLANNTKIILNDTELSIVDEYLKSQLLIIDSKLTDKGKRFCKDYLSINTFDIDELEDEIIDFIDHYRALFKGYKPGSMGDKNACLDKMKRFYKKYPEYANKEIILNATKRYINNMNNYQYLKQADYFIFKQDNNKIETSLLFTYCEEISLTNEEKNETFTEMI